MFSRLEFLHNWSFNLKSFKRVRTKDFKKNMLSNFFHWISLLVFFVIYSISRFQKFYIWNHENVSQIVCPCDTNEKNNNNNNIANKKSIKKNKSKLINFEKIKFYFVFFISFFLCSILSAISKRWEISGEEKKKSLLRFSYLFFWSILLVIFFHFGRNDKVTFMTYQANGRILNYTPIRFLRFAIPASS